MRVSGYKDYELSPPYRLRGRWLLPACGVLESWFMVDFENGCGDDHDDDDDDGEDDDEHNDDEDEKWWGWKKIKIMMT